MVVFFYLCLANDILMALSSKSIYFWLNCIHFSRYRMFQIIQTKKCEKTFSLVFYSKFMKKRKWVIPCGLFSFHSFLFSLLLNFIENIIRHRISAWYSSCIFWCRQSYFSIWKFFIQSKKIISISLEIFLEWT